MKTGKHIFLSCFSFLLALLTAASCGFQNNPDPASDAVPPDAVQTEEGTKAVAEFHYLEITENLEYLQGAYAFDDEWLYIMESPYEASTDLYTHVDRIRISDGYEEKSFITSGWNTTEYGANVFLTNQDGNCYLFWIPHFKAERGIYALEKYGKDGTLLWRTEYTPDQLLDMGKRLNKGTLTSDGRVLLYCEGSDGKIFSFDGDGSLEEVYTSELEVLDGVVAGPDGKAYEYCLTDNNPLFRELGGKASYASPIVPLEAYDGYEEGIFLRTGEGMWSYIPETGETRQLWGWEDEYIQINSDCINRFFCSGGKFLLLCDEQDIMVSPHHTKPVLTFASISFEDARKYPPRQTVTMSISYVSYDNDILNQMAKLYNRQGKKYRIEIVEDLNEELLKKKLIQGEGADLIEISNIYAEDLAVLGAFEDLTPYYEASKKADGNDILESIRKVCIIGGMEICVIPSFWMDTLLAKEPYCAPEDWTVWKFLEMSRENNMFYEQNPGKIFHYCLGVRYGEYFVDAAKKKSRFDGEEFRRMLKECAAVETYHYTPDPGSGYTAFEDRDYLFQETHITSPWDIVSDDDENYSARFLGYPGWGGGEYKLNATAMFAINSASSQKEGAWDFLEYLLSAEFQDRVNWAFPVRKDSFENRLTDLYISPDRLDLIYYLGEPTIPSEKDIAFLRKMVNSAVRDSWGGKTNPIWEIVEDEAAMYFAGDATLDDTVAKIQNRMQTYLNE